MDFKDCTLQSNKKAFKKLKKILEAQIKTEKKIQADLPKNLKSNTKIEQLEWNVGITD